MIERPSFDHSARSSLRLTYIISEYRKDVWWQHGIQQNDLICVLKGCASLVCLWETINGNFIVLKSIALFTHEDHSYGRSWNTILEQIAKLYGPDHIIDKTCKDFLFV